MKVSIICVIGIALGFGVAQVIALKIDGTQLLQDHPAADHNRIGHNEDNQEAINGEDQEKDQIFLELHEGGLNSVSDRLNKVATKLRQSVELQDLLSLLLVSALNVDQERYLSLEHNGRSEEEVSLSAQDQGSSSAEEKAPPCNPTSEFQFQNIESLLKVVHRMETSIGENESPLPTN
uniref:Uncharacterized protein n=1 Tax=Spongospora subterranea TaxID=70186 RepID=A0A0H5R4Q0_9EUKA|eukprot:CRZ09123.1 hypothetical protein [Spongospora subterranea]